MSVPTGNDRCGKIVYDNKLYELRNSPLNQETIDRCYEVFQECGCMYYPTKACDFHNKFHYIVKNEKLYITLVECSIFIESKIEPCKDMFFKMFKQHENFFVSWFSEELKVVINMNASGDSRLVYDYDLLILKIKKGIVIESYAKKETVQGLKKLKNYIEE